MTEYCQTVVMVTHDPRAASFADRVLFLADGKLVSELPNPTPDAVLDAVRRLRPETSVVKMLGPRPRQNEA